MQFYRIHSAFLPKEVGIFPQVVDAIYPSTYDSPDALGSLLFQKSNNKTEIPIGRLHRKAKLTDLLSTGFLVSQPLISARLHDIFTHFAVFGIEFLRTSLVNKNLLEEGYYYLNIFQICFGALDFRQTRFTRLTDAISMVPIQEPKFSNAQDIEQAFRKQDNDVLNDNIITRPLVIKEIHIKKDCEFDLFALRGVLYGGSYLIVSEKLKTVLEKEKITGITFKQLNDPFP